MTEPLTIAPASASPERHADWVELLALSKADHNGSLQDIVQELRRSGSVEDVESDEDEPVLDIGSEKTQIIAEGAFSEIEDRLSACGTDPALYPFEVTAQYIQERPRDEVSSVYQFLLLLSKFGKDAGPAAADGADLFERLSAVAALQYFGGADRGVETYLFGFPRRVAPAGFKAALDDLCYRMGEGGGCRKRPTLKDQKDAKLDLAVWRRFEDRRHGQLIGFGQCATGENWPGKLTELQPTGFCRMWMYDCPTVDPVRLFFVPFRVESATWDQVCINGGIPFDRCRITALTTGIDADLEGECHAWAQYVRKACL